MCKTQKGTKKVERVGGKLPAIAVLKHQAQHPIAREKAANTTPWRILALED
jgi:hypothetical protein